MFTFRLLVEMPASQEEVLRHISNAMPAAGAGDCCEALNAAASEVFLRRRSMQSLKSGRSSVDRRSVCGDGEVPAVTESATTPPSDADEQNLTYERLKNLRPCPPVTISFDELSRKSEAFNTHSVHGTIWHLGPI